MGSFEIASFPFPNLGYDPVELFQNMWNSLVEGWLMVGAKGCSILSGLDWVRFFEVREVLLGSRTILPLAAHLPTNGVSIHRGTSIRLDNLLVRGSHCYVKALMVNNRIKENILFPIWVGLHIYCTSNQVCI